MSVTPLLADTVWRTSWQAGVLAVGVALTLRLLPRIPAAARVALWWIVCARFVIGLAWTNPIALPLLPPAAEPPVASFERQAIPADALPSPDAAALTTTASRVNRFDWNDRWPGLLVSIWLLGLAAQTLLTLRQWRAARALVSRAQPVIGEPRRQFADLCARVGVRRVPNLRESADVTAPLVIGIVTPTVLLPASATATWPASRLMMSLAHELIHIRRNDLLYGWIPAAAGRLFFFHPLARHAAHEYALAREAACDAQTVTALGVQADDYARMLVRFGVTSGAPATAVASATFRTLKRRLAMLEDPRAHARTLSSRWLAATCLVTVVAVPFRLTARTPGDTTKAGVATSSATIDTKPTQPDSIAGTSEAHAAAPVQAAQTTSQPAPEQTDDAQAQLQRSLEAKRQKLLDAERTLVEAKSIDRHQVNAQIEALKSEADAKRQQEAAQLERLAAAEARDRAILRDGTAQFILAQMAEMRKRLQEAERDQRLDQIDQLMRQYDFMQRRYQAVLGTTGDVRPPVKIVHIDPVYPPVAMERNITGLVMAQFEVGADGQVQEPRILQSEDPLLSEAVRDALRKWRFQPMVVNGEPVPCSYTVMVVFQHSGQPALEDGVARAMLQLQTAGLGVSYSERVTIRAR